METGVFISYSSTDREFLKPVVTLIRSLRRDLVFQDYTDIRVGQKWEPQLLSALESAKTVVVFWCTHSAQSEYVKKEYERAIKDNKDVMPIILDGSKLPEGLSAYQGIDMSNFVAHKKPRKRHTSDDSDYEGYEGGGYHGGMEGAAPPRREYDYDDQENDYKEKWSEQQAKIAALVHAELDRRLPVTGDR